MRARSVLALVIPAVLAAGCSVSVGGLDPEKVEAAIVEGVREQTGIELTSVECPEDIESEAGATFICTGSDDADNSATIDVTQDDDEGNVSWNLRAYAPDDMAELEAQIAQGLTEQTGIEPSDVTCPEWTLIGAGNRYSCAATDPEGNQAEVAITIEDEEGNIDWEIV
jgi:hypothetical protein